MRNCYSVYHASGEHLATCKFASDAAAILANLDLDGAFIAWQPSQRFITLRTARRNVVLLYKRSCVVCQQPQEAAKIIYANETRDIADRLHVQ